MSRESLLVPANWIETNQNYYSKIGYYSNFSSHSRHNLSRHIWVVCRFSAHSQFHLSVFITKSIIWYLNNGGKKNIDKKNKMRAAIMRDSFIYFAQILICFAISECKHGCLVRCLHYHWVFFMRGIITIHKFSCATFVVLNT